jgi:hypothetical protein
MGAISCPAKSYLRLLLGIDLSQGKGRRRSVDLEHLVAPSVLGWFHEAHLEKLHPC